MHQTASGHHVNFQRQPISICFCRLQSILFYPRTMEGRRGTADEFATTPFRLVLFSAALVELAKSIPVHSLILFSHLFFCLPPFFLSLCPVGLSFVNWKTLKHGQLSFCFLTRVRSSSYSPMAAWIFLRSSSLVTWSSASHLKSLRSFSLTLQSRSMIHGHTEICKITRERISFTFDPRDMFLSLRMGFSFVRVAVACAILERTSGLEPSSETTAPRYLKLATVPNFCPFTFISLWMSLALFVISGLLGTNLHLIPCAGFVETFF